MCFWKVIMYVSLRKEERNNKLQKFSKSYIQNIQRTSTTQQQKSKSDMNSTNFSSREDNHPGLPKTEEVPGTWDFQFCFVLFCRGVYFVLKLGFLGKSRQVGHSSLQSCSSHNLFTFYTPATLIKILIMIKFQ